MVTQVDFLSQTFAPAVQGEVGTAPKFFVASSDQTAAVITTAGAIADLVSAGIVKPMDIIYVNGDMDGTPFQNVYTVTDTSGGTLIPYAASVGGALLAANNLSDVLSAATSRTNLGLGTGNNVQFLNVFAGTSGAAGVLRSYPSAATSGYLGLIGVANAGDYAVTISNASHGQATNYKIADVGSATGSLLNSALAAADPMSNLIWFDVTVGFAALAAGGNVALVTSSGSKQYKVRELMTNSGGTNFSGGGGDRLLAISDGTTVYSVIPAASIQTLANVRWGATALPFPAAAAINTSTAAGANLRAIYSGGAADYTAGSVVISGCVQRVA